MLFEKGLLLDNVAVHPEYQRKGLGKELINFAGSKAIQNGYSEIYLYTNERMTENISIYKHLGFIETERCLKNGRSAVYMRKQL
jgi:ribosomal protein S18 acetylase RimI-like enzyme